MTPEFLKRNIEFENKALRVLGLAVAGVVTIGVAINYIGGALSSS